MNGYRVLLLGAGGVGRAAARFAAARGLCGELVIADRDAAAARAALSASGAKGEARQGDVTQARDLRALMDEADIVLNCVGPFYRFARPMLEAAIETGTDYLDICDDWEPTLDMLGLDAAAANAGVTAIIGQGASPGTANILARAVAEAVASPDHLITGWSLDDDAGDPASAANEHWLHQASGLIRIWRGGTALDAPALEEVDVALPGLPPREALTIGHPEAVTLPRRYPGLQTCLNVMTLPGALAATLIRAAGAVRDGADLKATALSILDAHVPGSGPDHPAYPGVWAWAKGAGGSAGAWLADYGAMTDMATTTAAPLIAGMELVLGGKAARTGVLTPEDAFSPEIYFPALARVTGASSPMLELVRA